MNYLSVPQSSFHNSTRQSKTQMHEMPQQYNKCDKYNNSNNMQFNNKIINNCPMNMDNNKSFMNEMCYAYVPKKVIEKIPSYDTTCPKCGSVDTYPFMNCPGSSRNCQRCKLKFEPKITGYKEYLREV